MIEIEWIKIPEGEFLFGLSDKQQEAIRARLRDEFGIDQMSKNERLVLESLTEKYRRTARGEGRYLDDLTPEEQRIKPQWNDPLFSYLLAEAEIERIPRQQRLWTPTFYIARFPITHAQCDIFFASDYACRQGLLKQRICSAEDLPNMPEEVSWEIAEAMAHWLGGRLPSRVEWEKAARGSEGQLYPWGDKWDPSRGNFGYEYRPEYSQKHGIWRTVVDAYPGGASPYGVMDMLGNLAEWTVDQMPQARKNKWSKGISAHDVPKDIPWFWSILARQTPGGRGGIGFRPVLDQWQQRVWPGATVSSAE